MKRSHKLLSHHPHKTYKDGDKVFEITKVSSEVLEREGMPQNRTCCSSKENELIMTEELLSRMTPNQQYTCFKKQAYKLKQLKKKLRRFSLEERIIEAKEKLKDITFELSDQRFIVDNMIEALKIGALLPNTLQYDRLCSIVRNTMNLKSQPKTGNHLILPKKIIAITEKEQRQYTKLAKRSSLLEVIMGELPKNLGEVENYLDIHAELIMNMSYKDFIKVIKK